MSKLIVGLLVCSLFVFYPAVGETAEPTLAQCQGEPSKGTGWGTFWFVIGGLNTVGGAVIAASPDTFEDAYGDAATAVGLVNVGVGLGLGYLGFRMRSSAQSYNRTCSTLLSGVNVEPLTDEGTNVGLVYRYRW